MSRLSAIRSVLNRRYFWLLVSASVVGTARSQALAVKASLDAGLTFIQDSGSSRFRTYTALGRQSTFNLEVLTEYGIRAHFAQRIETIPNDPDHDTFETAYFESPRQWRAGKQYLPFGPERLIRESVLAVRSDIDFPGLDLPIAVAACDAGTGRQQGVVVRVGKDWGASVAVGRHFGIAATSLDYIRNPENSPGVGHGFQRAYDLFFSHKSGAFEGSIEFLSLQEGETASDLSDTVIDAQLKFLPTKYRIVTLGATHSSALAADFLRAGIDLYATPTLSFEPMVRVRNGKFYDFSVTVHFKI